MSVYSKLLSVQSKLIAPKNQYNSFGKYKYRNCEDILEALKPILLQEKATLIVSDVIEKQDERFYVKATAEFIDCETGEKLQVTAYAREETQKKGMDGSQITGSSSSYARKYALNGLFCIDDNKDADNGKPPEPPKQPKAPKEPKAMEQQLKCQDCGCQIIDTIVNDKTYTVQQIIKNSNKKLNKQLCMQCVSLQLGGK